MVVQVFIALAQSEHALAQQLLRLVFDQQRAARVGECSGDRIQQPQAPIHLAEQQQPAVRTDRATPEIRFDYTASETPKFNLICGTLWHRHSPSQNLVRNQILCGFQACADPICRFCVKYPG